MLLYSYFLLFKSTSFTYSILLNSTFYFTLLSNLSISISIPVSIPASTPIPVSITIYPKPIPPSPPSYLYLRRRGRSTGLYLSNLPLPYLCLRRRGRSTASADTLSLSPLPFDSFTLTLYRIPSP